MNGSKFSYSDFAVVNRTCWPSGQVTGEALLSFSESLATQVSVVMIGQSNDDLEAKAAHEGRGDGVSFLMCRMRATSESSVFLRVFDAVIFAIWVFCSLLRSRAKFVYVATDPPIVVPFAVFIYSKLFRAKYIYHLQDIHPEATDIVKPVNKLLFRFLKFIDNVVICHSSLVITLSDQMARYIDARLGKHIHTVLISNPGIPLEYLKINIERDRDIIFCGNAGRMQRIPLLIEAIDTFLMSGGKLTFSFVGGGGYLPELQALSEKHSEIEVHGSVSAQEAAKFMCMHRWGIMPICDEVTKYAFPSKSSSYMLAGCGVIAVTSFNTAVADWVGVNQCGLVVEPTVKGVVSTLRCIESGEISFDRGSVTSCMDAISIDSFVCKLVLEIENKIEIG
jgi:glycosyltransferase involved in cell wall biosynthesis